MFKVFLYICKNHRVMEEIWKDIKGYEGLYQVSNLGRVRSLDKLSLTNRHKREEYRKLKGKILKPIKDYYGYLRVGLYKNQKETMHPIHRLVIEAFKPNPLNLPCINHINEIKTDNQPENLEYCTFQYNTEYSCAKPILQYDKQGNFIKEWGSLSEIQRQLGCSISNISNCCLRKFNRKSTYGFKWYYKPILWNTTKFISGRYSPETLLKKMGVQS